MPQALKSFAYASISYSSGLLTFSSTGAWQMGIGTGMAAPGAGTFPSSDYYVRAIGVTVPTGSKGNWVMIGHSGPNGDWMCPPVLVGESKWFLYPQDACPLFSAGEYFDAHVASSDASVLVGFWVTPTTLPAS